MCAKIGAGQDPLKDDVGQHGPEECNERGDMRLD